MPVRKNRTATRKSVRTNGDSVRLNLLLPKDLKDFAFDHAKKKSTNVTQLIKDYFVRLREEENNARPS